MQQWSGFGSGKFDLRAKLAETIHALTRNNAWEQATSKQLSHETLRDILMVRNPFLRKLILHDVFVSHKCGEKDTDLVGGGARDICLRATGWKGKTDSAHATREASKRLAKLHHWLVKKLNPASQYVRQVLPYGFLLRHAQHACCELRKWNRRKKQGKGRKRCAKGSIKRAETRSRRLTNLWRHLGFQKVPAMCRCSLGNEKSQKTWPTRL